MFLCQNEMDEYYKNMLVINGVKFTPRHIDVISCIANARIKHQQIDDILGIEITVVPTHIAAIRERMRQKPGIGNDIIPFIEKTPNYKAIKEHYKYLLRQYEFENLLKRISKVRSHDQYKELIIYYIWPLLHKSQNRTTKFQKSIIYRLAEAQKYFINSLLLRNPLYWQYTHRIS